MNKHIIEHTEGSGNPYEDLGLSHPEERLAKARLASRINEIIQERKLKQIDAAACLGINQPKVSALMNGRLEGFSLERLIHFLNLLELDVEITVKSRRSKHHAQGSLVVRFAG